MVLLICQWLIWTQLQWDHRSSNNMRPSLTWSRAPPIHTSLQAAPVECVMSWWPDNCCPGLTLPYTCISAICLHLYVEVWWVDSVEVIIYSYLLLCAGNTSDSFSLLQTTFVLSHLVGSRPWECFPFVQMAHIPCHVCSAHQEVNKPLVREWIF